MSRRGINMSDIPKLLTRLEEYLVATEKARGSSREITKAQPLELELYNIATNTKNRLGAFKALIEDSQGTYGKGKK
jgi:hypothetical protein